MDYIKARSTAKAAAKRLKNNLTRGALIAGASLIALTALLLLTVINVSNSDYAPDANPSAKFATLIPLSHTFDCNDKITPAVVLSWEDGAVDLEDGEAHARIRAKVYPITLSDTSVDWSVSDEEIAEIDADGAITAKKSGKVYITAKANGADASAKASLSVRQPVSSIFLPTSTITLYAGGEGRLLTAQVYPDDATDKTVIWKSKDTKIARVSSGGHVIPVSTGITEITATTEDGGFEGKCFINVINKTVEIEEISVKNGDGMSIAAGSSINAIVTVSPSNAKNKTLRWSSDNTEVASVSQTGRIRGKSEGTANITVEAVNGVKTVFPIEITASEEGDPFDLRTGTVSEGGVTYTSYSSTLIQAVGVQMSQNPPPKTWHSGVYEYAAEAEVIQYMNPSSYYTDAYKYQFLDLSQPNGVSEEALNAYLQDKGVLSGQGAAFIEAANRYSVSEVYLVAHACLETGNGTSRLATGVEVNGTTVYNMFGINAYDSDPVGGGSNRAYAEGWTSVEAAIDGGARWISENYINSAYGRQNTLYKMKWNPENPGYHQYATDITWAVSQAVNIEKIFAQFDGASLSFDVPVYNGQIPPTITMD